jgi:hypothetical protein
MRVTKQYKSTKRKSRPIVTFSTINPTQTELWLKLVLCYQRPVTCLNYNMVMEFMKPRGIPVHWTFKLLGPSWICEFVYLDRLRSCTQRYLSEFDTCTWNYISTLNSLNLCYPVSAFLMICEVVVMWLNCMNEICGYISALICKLEAAWVNWFLMICMYEIDCYCSEYVSCSWGHEV